MPGHMGSATSHRQSPSGPNTSAASSEDEEEQDNGIQVDVKSPKEVVFVMVSHSLDCIRYFLYLEIMTGVHYKNKMAVIVNCCLRAFGIYNQAGSRYKHLKTRAQISQTLGVTLPAYVR